MMLHVKDLFYLFVLNKTSWQLLISAPFKNLSLKILTDFLTVSIQSVKINVTSVERRSFSMSVNNQITISLLKVKRLNASKEKWIEKDKKIALTQF